MFTIEKVDDAISYFLFREWNLLNFYKTLFWCADNFSIKQELSCFWRKWFYRARTVTSILRVSGIANDVNVICHLQIQHQVFHLFLYYNTDFLYSCSLINNSHKCTTRNAPNSGWLVLCFAWGRKGQCWAVFHFINLFSLIKCI